MLALMNAQTNSMNGRDLINSAARFGLIAALALFVIGQLVASAAPAEANSLKPPAKGDIPIAFVISEGAVVSLPRCHGFRRGSPVPSLHHLRHDFPHPRRRRDADHTRLHVCQRAGAEGRRYPRSK